jgi:hypothetical protein
MKTLCYFLKTLPKRRKQFIVFNNIYSILHVFLCFYLFLLFTAVNFFICKPHHFFASNLLDQAIIPPHLRPLIRHYNQRLGYENQEHFQG